MTARFAGKCAKTGEPFKAGERVFYYPSTKQTFAGDAARDASADFQACAEDEAFASGQCPDFDSGGNY